MFYDYGMQVAHTGANHTYLFTSINFRMNNQTICSETENIKVLKLAKEHVCEECVKIGGSWLHLRTCQTCGVTLCCNSSPNQHMTAHYHHTAHPVVISAEKGERWLWCYKHEIFVEY